MRVGLFVTCLVDLMRPPVGFSAAKLIEAAGHEVIVPAGQTCCGQPGWNSGDRKSARALAEKLIVEFEACDCVVVPSGSVVCPVKIPLPELLRKLREKQVERRLRPWREMAAIRLWSWTAQHPRLYALATAFAARLLRVLGGRSGTIAALPFGSEWTRGRVFPAPKSGRTFRSLYAARVRRREREARR